MNWNATWIKPAVEPDEAASVFFKAFNVSASIKKATLVMTALGTYEAVLNDKRVSDFVLAPAWTTYEKRLQYQTYDVTDLLASDNELYVTVGKGWYRSRLAGWTLSGPQERLRKNPCGLLLMLTIEYEDGKTETIVSDESWICAESKVRFSEIYDGEIYDAAYEPVFDVPAVSFDGPWNTLIPQQGEEIREQDRLAAADIFVTPKGETVIDFGQNLTGYVEVTVNGNAGDVLDISFAEVMDKHGNFYTDNYRSAKAIYRYICQDGQQTYKPKLTFWGFRYIRINEFPGGIDQVKPENFTAIVVHSQLKRTGYLSSSNPKLNKLFENIIWGQKGNFLDVPTDCPQRDERLGWTGDAQVFIRTACLNYDCEKFFTKWLTDLAADQHEDGYVGHVIPDVLPKDFSSAAWGDAAAICPWQVYLAYGNKDILENQFESMTKWVDYMTSVTTTPYLWTGGTEHYGDWLGLDAPALKIRSWDTRDDLVSDNEETESGSYKGITDEDLIASAFYAYSTSLVIKAGKVLGKDVSKYEELYEKTVETFRSTYPEYKTQTACVLAIRFGLSTDPQATADQLSKMIAECGGHLETGFVGTPYLLHVLSTYGYADLAYSLLLREEYPSWLYPVTKGATTIWEHWDGIMPDGNFWSSDMNSYNHYAYGAVADWVYSAAAGINTVEDAPGYEKIIIKPTPDVRLDWLKASLETRHGLVSSKWEKQENNFWRYDIVTPSETTIIIGDKEYQVKPGSYTFYSKL